MFLLFCHLLNVLRLSWLAATLRWLVLRAFADKRTYGYYHNHEQIGYLGWIKLPWFGPVAFIRLDGSRQFRW